MNKAQSPQLSDLHFYLLLFWVWSRTQGPAGLASQQHRCPLFVARSCPTLHNPMDCSMSRLPVHHHSWSSPKPMSIDLVLPSNHLVLCRPLLLLPSIFPSTKKLTHFPVSLFFPSGGQSIYWNSSFSISPSNEYSGLIFFRID